MPRNIVFFPSHTSPENNNKSKAEYTNTQQDLTVRWSKITNSLDMQSFLAGGFVLPKATKNWSLPSKF